MSAKYVEISPCMYDDLDVNIFEMKMINVIFHVNRYLFRVVSFESANNFHIKSD